MNLVQRIRPFYWEEMEDQLSAIFYQIIFQPIAEVLEKFNHQIKGLADELQNANFEPLRDALRSGRVQYSGGIFSGQFSGAIGKAIRAMGASFDSRQKVYRLAVSSVPGWVRAEAGFYKAVAEEAHKELKKVLGYIETAMDQLVDKHPVNADSTIGKVEKDFEPIARAIEVHPKLSKESKEKLSKDYTQNMKLWIKNFSEETIEDLRGDVEKNAQQGYRFDRLVDMIQQRRNVSKNKAKFLARQETALFMSKFQARRFEESGIFEYTWSTSHDSRVRPTADTHGRARLNDHRHLNGKDFFYKSPPIVDLATGRRANPGEDYGCRCVAIPKMRRKLEDIAA